MKLNTALYGLGGLTIVGGGCYAYFTATQYLYTAANEKLKEMEQLAQKRAEERARYVLVLKTAGITVLVTALLVAGYKSKKLLEGLFGDKESKTVLAASN